VREREKSDVVVPCRSFGQVPHDAEKKEKRRGGEGQTTGMEWNGGRACSHRIASGRPASPPPLMPQPSQRVLLLLLLLLLLLSCLVLSL
jgi:hypothetical protein